MTKLHNDNSAMLKKVKDKSPLIKRTSMLKRRQPLRKSVGAIVKKPNDMMESVRELAS